MHRLLAPRKVVVARLLKRDQVLGLLLNHVPRLGLAGKHPSDRILAELLRRQRPQPVELSSLGLLVGVERGVRSAALVQKVELHLGGILGAGTRPCSLGRVKDRLRRRRRRGRARRARRRGETGGDGGGGGGGGGAELLERDTHAGGGGGEDGPGVRWGVGGGDGGEGGELPQRDAGGGGGGGEGDAEGGRRAGQVHGEPGELGDGDEGALRTEAREGLPHRPVQS
eukprot:scaffold105775_cov33-Phaeocystis_antarctica.AAC.1